MAANNPQQGVPSREQATIMFEVARRQLFGAWDRLHSTVVAHEDKIRKRWEKKTGVRRRTILKSVRPNLPEMQPPEVLTLEESQRNQANMHIFLFGYLNLDDLSNSGGSKFLSLLHYRSHKFPSEFSRTDDERLHAGSIVGNPRRVDVPNCTMLSFGDRELYGTVVGWGDTFKQGDELVSGFDLQHKWGEALALADGIAVLETQWTLLEFLHSVVRQLLTDQQIQDLEVVPSDTPTLPPPAIPVTGGTYNWHSSAIDNHLQPFVSPPEFSYHRLEIIADAGYDLARDHLVNLRTDPTYLSEQLKLGVAHRMESMASRPASQNLVQAKSVSSLLVDAYTFFAYWHMLKTVLVDVKEKLAIPVNRGQPLTPEYQAAFHEVYTVLIRIQETAELRFPSILCGSPSFRKHFHVVYANSSYDDNQITSRPHGADKLFSILLVVFNHRDRGLVRWQVRRVYDELDNLISTPGSHERISPLLADELFMLMASNDALRTLEHHTPMLEEESLQDTNRRMTKWGPLLGRFQSSYSKMQKTGLVAAAFPEDKFLYPKGTKTEEWAQKCKAVDDAFGKFWEIATAFLPQNFGRELFELVEGAFKDSGVPRPVINWAEFVKRKQQVPSQPSGDNLTPTPGAELSARDSSPGPSSDAGAQERIAVPARSFKVFSMLLPTETDGTPREGFAAWQDVLTAFGLLQFDLYKVRGSVWRFTHPDGRYVNVHEPYPEPKLDYAQAHRFGLKLTEKFGWTSGSFILAVAQ